MQYVLYTSNNILACALSEHGIVAAADTAPPSALAGGEPCLLIIDSTHKGRSIVNDWLPGLLNNTPCAAVILQPHTATLSTELSGLEGMVEFCTIPFRLGDLLDILERLSRAIETRNKQNLMITEHLLLLPGTRELRYLPTNHHSTLTEKETLLLTALHQAGASGLTKEALLEAVWSYHDGVDTHTLETHIYRLRQKIKDITAQDKGITFKDGTYTIDF